MATDLIRITVMDRYELLLTPMEVRELRFMLIRVIGMDPPAGFAQFVNEDHEPTVMRIEPVMPFDKPAESEWVDDPHDIEQGRIKNPNYKP